MAVYSAPSRDWEIEAEAGQIGGKVRERLALMTAGLGSIEEILVCRPARGLEEQVPVSLNEPKLLEAESEGPIVPGWCSIGEV